MRYYLYYYASTAGAVSFRLDQIVITSGKTREYKQDLVIDKNIPWAILARDILDVLGVISVEISPYEVDVKKASVFSWEEIIPKVLKALLLNLDIEGKAIETQEPTAALNSHVFPTFESENIQESRLSFPPDFAKALSTLVRESCPVKNSK